MTPTGRRLFLVHPSNELYGSDRVALDVAGSFIDAGWQVTAVVPETGALCEALEGRGAEVLNCRTIVLRKSVLRPTGLAMAMATAPAAALRIVRLLRRLKPDVVYVNTVTIPLWAVVARLLGFATVVHVHEAEEDLPRVIKVALAAPLLAAHRVIVNSRASASTVTSSIGRLRAKLRLIYNAVPGPAVATAPRESLDGPVRLVLVGRLSPRKGIDVALSAVAALKVHGFPVRLDIYGSAFTGYEWYVRQLENQIEEFGLSDTVTLHGFVENVWPVLADADVALVPSRVEPFGNAAVEAQLARRPVIVSDAQGLVETVENGRFGRVVSAGDADALAGAIRDTASQWDSARQTSIAACGYAQAAFAPERFAREVVEVAEAILIAAAPTEPRT